MSDDTQVFQLILRQRPAASSELDDLSRMMHREHGLDPYTTRQRLIGPGLSMLTRGSRAKVEKIAALLRLHGYACWLIKPQRPAFDTELLRSLTIHNDLILFTCQKEVVRLERGASVVGVLADLSGGLVDKHVKRLLAQNAYRGSGALTVLSHDEMIQTILQGQPVFDFYLLDREDKIQRSVQVMPGRFNVDGLGGRASMSSSQNLMAIVRLVEEYAGKFSLYCDFGLSQLPRCSVIRASESTSAAMENLASLSNYGWLVTQLSGDGLAETSYRNDSVSDSTALKNESMSRPDARDGFSPGLGKAADEIPVEHRAADAATVARQSAENHASRDLPPPPERSVDRFDRGRLFITIGLIAVGLLVIAGYGGRELFQLVYRYGMTAGVLPAVAAMALFWYGLYFIRLKRSVENTPTSKVRSIAMGLVEVHGRTRRLYALVSPMTQSACAWYRLRKYRKDNNNRWKLTRDIDSSHVPFQIDDGTGRVTIDPVGASVTGTVQQTGYPGQAPLTLTAFASDGDTDEKWVEDIIYEGTSLYVLGCARPQKEERLGLRERTLNKLRQLKLDPRAMRRYDTDGDGQIDEVEWEEARKDAEQDALQEYMKEGRGRKRQEELVTIGKGPQRSLPFIVAETVSETQLTRKYGLISLFLLVAGAGASALAIYAFLHYIRI